jgi:hypothetical protein
LKTPITRPVWFFVFQKNQKLCNIKSFFLLEEKLCMGKKMSGKAGFFAHGINIIIIFLCEGRLELLK